MYVLSGRNLISSSTIIGICYSKTFFANLYTLLISCFIFTFAFKLPAPYNNTILLLWIVFRLNYYFITPYLSTSSIKLTPTTSTPSCLTLFIATSLSVYFSDYVASSIIMILFTFLFLKEMTVCNTHASVRTPKRMIVEVCL